MTSLIAVLLFIVLFGALAAWSTLAQARFFRQLRRTTGENLLLDGVIQERYLTRPWRWFRDAPGVTVAMLKAINSPQADPAVEQARREYLRRRRVQWVVSGLAIALLILYLNVLRTLQSALP